MLQAHLEKTIAESPRHPDRLHTETGWDSVGVPRRSLIKPNRAPGERREIESRATASSSTMPVTMNRGDDPRPGSVRPLVRGTSGRTGPESGRRGHVLRSSLSRETFRIKPVASTSRARPHECETSTPSVPGRCDHFARRNGTLRVQKPPGAVIGRIERCGNFFGNRAIN